ncbi:MAG: hypothetical protein RLZZ546_1003, partial [Bacteroidota bacterium]
SDYGFGIFKYENDHLKSKNYTRYGNSPLYTSRSAAIDQYNNIWVANDKNLIKFKQNTISFHSKENSSWDGIPYPFIYYSQNSNTLYASQKDHFLFFKPDSTNNSKNSKVVLTDLVISNLKGLHPNDFDNITLSQKQSTIKLLFSNMNFTNSANNFYEYRMNDDTTWIAMEGPDLLFSNIGHGKHFLEVRSYNSFGELSKENYIVHFEILPPFYRTLWFQTFILGLISFLIYAFFKYRENQTKKLEKIRHNIARNLHDDLGSNLSNIKIISEIEAAKNKHKDNEAFSHIAEKTKAMMSSISDIVWSINPNNDTLDEIIQKIQTFSIDTIEKMDINLFFDIPENLPKLNLPIDYRGHIYLISKEAINNIAKYSKAKNVYFTIKLEGKLLFLSFKDDGIGFDEATIKKGNGLRNMKARVHEMKGSMDIQSSHNGTNVTFKINIP